MELKDFIKLIELAIILQQKEYLSESRLLLLEQICEFAAYYLRNLNQAISKSEEKLND